MPVISPDVDYLQQALKLAARGRGHTSPNPMVGAVVVARDRVVGKGYHERLGRPHAEVNALRRAGALARGATLYVTLEPCNHQGRTPPCTAAIVEAGISRVVVGMADPNPHVRGGGAEYLRRQGLLVDMGLLERPCRLLNQAFIKHVQTGLPYVTLKAAATLDGRIATRTGDSRWISNDRSRRFAHQLRCALDAILVGVETAQHDDPQLTARIRRRPPCRQPLRVVLDSRLRLDDGCQLVQSARQAPVWVVCGLEAPARPAAALERAGVRVVRLPIREGRVDLPCLLEELGRHSVTSLLVEGGAGVLGAFLEAGLADELFLFLAPKILADPGAVPLFRGAVRHAMTEAIDLPWIEVKRFGDDVLVHARFRAEIY